MATEKRLIDANDVYDLFGVNGFARLHVGDIDTIPAVDAVEVVHGRWIEEIEKNEVFESEMVRCSVCGQLRFFESNYCPNCGAKMDGDGNG